jgi:hypothetical protein
MRHDDSTKREAGLTGDSPAEAIGETKPFKIKARKLGLPKEWTSGSVSELIEMLEGPGYPPRVDE